LERFHPAGNASDPTSQGHFHRVMDPFRVSRKASVTHWHKGCINPLKSI